MKAWQIDDINNNILQALMKDARTSFTQMAKENNTSVAAIRNRYINLEKAGVINGSMTYINPHFIGFDCYGFLGVKVHPKNKQEIWDYLIKQPYILSIWHKTQEINIGTFFAASNLDYFTAVTDELRSHPHVKSIQPLIFVGLPHNHYPENLTLQLNQEIKNLHSFEEDFEVAEYNEDEEPFKKQLFRPVQLTKMKKTDREIAKILTNDARTPFSYIANHLNKSTAFVINRYAKLKEKGLFIRSSITLDLKKLGYQANAMVYITAKIGTKISDVHRAASEIPNVISLTKIIGSCDMLAIIPLASFTDLFTIEKQLRTINGIEKIQININPPFTKWPANMFGSVF
ncbi:MAG: Lrp/AsnC family transcriptional regulator [Candidatus Bathyarchaeota archaeon]|nr:MAG: Lrp/AsnC family transcriptional regulator [Candidatus Bathyarchaeota archaeon]